MLGHIQTFHVLAYICTGTHAVCTHQQYFIFFACREGKKHKKAITLHPVLGGLFMCIIFLCSGLPLRACAYLNE